jgi:uncharacterized protein
MKSNALIHESSPYLLQHAHNPVDWLPWNDSTLEKALKEDKPIIVSIGYSACHWCHVMEQESFEDEETATMMNKNFICIKVDREERPDIDQLYMSALQLMSGKGGWPLNCIAMPDGRPFFGGTYFPRKNWQDVLRQISNLFINEREKVEEYAMSLSNGIRQTELMKIKNDHKVKLSTVDLESSVESWMHRVDQQEGGPNHAPKFPLPNNYLFLLRFGYIKKDNMILDHVHLTLRKMAYGGIYDQLGGGFARYSTDMLWKVPHFEKMLYDNTQLISLYAEAWQQHADPLYKTICEETADFIMRELRNPEGWFYSSLDADSEGVEGLYYTWEKEEIQEILEPDDYKIFSAYYNLNEEGYWEDDRYILLRREEDSLVASNLGISLDYLLEKLVKIKAAIRVIREKRTRPGLDHKLLVSWNAMAISAFANLYRVFGTFEYLNTAEIAAEYLLKNLSSGKGRLMHSNQISGFLEDYSMMADACISLYQASYNEKWLFSAYDICTAAIAEFQDKKSGFFWFNSSESKIPVSNIMEVSDNVIPASNSVMALNLYKLGIWFGIPGWLELSRSMLQTVSEELLRYLPGHSNWGILALLNLYPSFELAICGEAAVRNSAKITTRYMPDVLIAACETESKLPFMEGRSAKKEQYFLCRNQVCMKPVFNISDLDQILQEGRTVENH